MIPVIYDEQWNTIVGLRDLTDGKTNRMYIEFSNHGLLWVSLATPRRIGMWDRYLLSRSGTVLQHETVPWGKVENA